MLYIWTKIFKLEQPSDSSTFTPPSISQGAEEAIIQIRNIYNFTIYITLRYEGARIKIRARIKICRKIYEGEFLLLISIDNEL